MNSTIEFRLLFYVTAFMCSVIDYLKVSKTQAMLVWNVRIIGEWRIGKDLEALPEHDTFPFLQTHFFWDFKCFLKIKIL
jgi:hypothetical protein